MANEYYTLKMKRKDINDDDVYNDFSLSSPARKIRRLDVELPPIIEQEEPPQTPLELKRTEEIEAPLNQERALVLYKPVRQQHEPSSITVNHYLIPGFRNGVFWHGHSNFLKSEDDQLESKEHSDNSLAVVPWVSYKMPSAPVVHASAMTELSEPMEADDVEGANMEIEEEYSMSGCEEQTGKINGSDDVLHQWHQQHCMSPQRPPNTAVTPSMWSW